MSLDCYCDYDPPSVFSDKIVKARKPHRCDECCREIRTGEQYLYAFGVWDGYASSWHTCSHCREIQKFVSINIPCFCWTYGNMLEDAEEAISEAYYRAADEVRGLRFGFGRLLVKAKHAKASANRFSPSLSLTPEASTPADAASPPGASAGTNSEAQP